jgi:ABC-type multidrug transport system permease subunit
MRGLWNHFLITLLLNCRNIQALIFGYGVPVFFLIAFAAVFGHDSKSLGSVMGKLMTISALGGACFGLPIAMVSERDRGVWRRYRLTPMGSGWFIVSTMLARYVLVLSSAALQFVLALVIYHMELPQHPLELLLSFSCAAFAFIGIGLIIATVANSIGSVQALGQSLFLPMIMIGGVGIPLHVLPVWAKHVSLFMPGRYAVDAINNAFREGVERNLYSLAALLMIGAAATLVGWKLFRWESSARLDRHAAWWIALALAMWVLAGAISEIFHLAPG